MNSKCFRKTAQILLVLFMISCEDKKDSNEETSQTNNNIAWGQLTTDEPIVFAARDVSQSTIDLTLNWYKIGRESWGSYGPVEIWIVGKDKDAVIELDKLWCKHRVEMDLKWKTDWDCANGDPYNSGTGWSPFYRYINDGGAAVSTYRRDYIDYHFMTITMSAKYPGPEEEDYRPVTLHEYFHIYQHAHINDIDKNGDKTKRGEKNGGEGKPWFAEGGAEYMAQLLYSRQEGVRSEYLKDVMKHKFNSVSDYKSFGKKLNQISYNDPVNTYDVGAWFIAYLVHLKSEKIFRVDFYKDLNALGFDGSFLKYFGGSPAKLIDDFNSFLDIGLNEAINIIP